MDYAFILADMPLSPSGGIKVQALMWKKGLEKLGHRVALINFWDTNELGRYDAVVVFGFSGATRALTRVASRYTDRLAIAPIIDPTMPVWKYRLLCRWWGCEKHVHLSNRYHDLWLVRDLYRLWLVRSDHEYAYVSRCFGIPAERIAKVPLHFRIDPLEGFPEKEDFCLHVSRLDEPIKNVGRLIAAARKYGFRLKLAGNLQGERGRRWLEEQMAGAPNIEYVGYLDEPQLKEVYRPAKVFALPSLVEGVGMGALEAAAYGAEIVLTEWGAPKEYYQGRALLVNPLSVDEIGQAVCRALKGSVGQPGLKEFVETNYSEAACMAQLNQSLATLCRR